MGVSERQGAWCAAVHGVKRVRHTEQLNQTELIPQMVHVFMGLIEKPSAEH